MLVSLPGAALAKEMRNPGLHEIHVSFQASRNSSPLSLLQLHHLELSLWIFLGSVYILVFKSFINVNIFCIFFYEQHFIGKST